VVETGPEIRASSGARKETGVNIVGIKRGSGMLFNPPSDTSIEQGDILITLGDATAIRHLEELAGVSHAD
jgi:uncharacterized protein with PhoU and TrkA domain